MTDKNLKVAVKIANILSDLISKAVLSQTDISDEDFAAAMSEYDEAKKKLAELDSGSNNGGD